MTKGRRKNCDCDFSMQMVGMGVGEFDPDLCMYPRLAGKILRLETCLYGFVKINTFAVHPTLQQKV